MKLQAPTQSSFRLRVSTRSKLLTERQFCDRKTRKGYPAREERERKRMRKVRRPLLAPTPSLRLTLGRRRGSVCLHRSPKFSSREKRLQPRRGLQAAQRDTSRLRGGCGGAGVRVARSGDFEGRPCRGYRIAPTRAERPPHTGKAAHRTPDS